MTFYSIIIDLIIVALVLIIIIKAYNNGFVKSIITLIGLVASLVLAVTLSETLAQLTYDALFSSKILDSISSVTDNILMTEIATVITAVMAAIPGYVSKLVRMYFGNDAGIAEKLEQNSIGLSENPAKTIEAHVVSPVIIAMLEVIFCILIFIVCVVVVNCIAGLFRGLRSVPILGFVNALLGAALGVLQAGVFIVIIVTVSKALISLSSNSWGGFNEEIINQSLLFKHFYNFKFIDVS